MSNLSAMLNFFGCCSPQTGKDVQAMGSLDMHLCGNVKPRFFWKKLPQPLDIFGGLWYNTRNRAIGLREPVKLGTLTGVSFAEEVAASPKLLRGGILNRL